MLNFKTNFYEKLFQSLDNNAVMMRVSPDGSYEPIWCTREFAEMMEGTEEECIRIENGSMSTIHPGDREEVAYLFRNHTTRSGVNNLTIRKYTMKGNLIWVNLHYAFIEEDGVLYAYCNFTNVTEIKESQAKAESMYESTRADLESLSNGALSFLRVNLTRDILEDIRGSDPFQFDPTPGADHVSEWQQYLPLESDRKRFAERISAESLINTFNSGVNHLTDYFFTQRLDGRKCFVKITENIRQDPTTGDIISFFTEYDYNNEMVNQTILNKALVEQYDMITSLIDGEYSVVIGDPGHIQGASIFPKENRGNYSKYIEEQVVPVLSGDEEEKAAMAESLRHETVVRELNKNDFYEADIVCELDGETCYKRFVFYVVNREAKFYILLKSDITEVIREQRERNELLASALKGAQQANEAKTAFLNSMSHEIRTPMNAIIGLDTIALSDPDLPEKTREQLLKIDSSAKHLLSLINDILDMSRIESGRMTLKNEEFSFRRMLEQINTMIGSQCEAKGLTYDCRVIGRVDDYYTGDDMKLKQVIINILGNAVKFTPQGGTVTFTVEQTARFADKSTLRFTMKDTGVGMDKDFLPKIFEAFSQEDENKSNKYGSTGLGMAITKSIVEMMNGNIKVVSEKGVGSTFTVNVTLKSSDKKESGTNEPLPQETEGQQESGSEQAFDGKADLAGRRILLAEDMLINAEIMKELLGMREIQADHAENGQLAIDMFAQSPANYYDAILMDVRMPVKDGLTATSEIRALDRPDAKTTPIIAMTANAFDEDVQRSLQAGMNAHLSKPVEPERLFETLESLIRNY